MAVRRERYFHVSGASYRLRMFVCGRLRRAVRTLFHASTRDFIHGYCFVYFRSCRCGVNAGVRVSSREGGVLTALIYGVLSYGGFVLFGSGG